MISEHGTVTIGSPKQGSRRWRQVAGGAIVALAVVGAIGAWQIRERSTSSTEDRAAETTAVGPGSGPVSAAVAGSPTQSYMYLVDSPEDAAFLRQMLAELNEQRRALGQPPAQDLVVEASALDADMIEALPRPPGTTMSDLRHRARLTGSSQEGPGVGVTQPAAGASREDTRGGLAELYDDQEATRLRHQPATAGSSEEETPDVTGADIPHFTP